MPWGSTNYMWKGGAVVLPLDHADESYRDYSYSEEYEYEYQKYKKEKENSSRKNQRKFLGPPNKSFKIY
jgi:hypothetical protein